ncbi:unnamed protein product, partial [Rotaria sp. Silwood1]
MTLTNSKSKFEHGLVKTDIDPKVLSNIGAIYSSDDEANDESESDVYLLSKSEEYSSSENETDDVPQITGA